MKPVGNENSIRRFLPKTIIPEQAKDTGMALVLVCLLIAYFGMKRQFVGMAILFLLVAMTWPMAYKHVARIWIGFSLLLGTVMSKVILSIVFLVLVVPVGLIRKGLGRDSLQIKRWKKGEDSVFAVRDHRFVSGDLKNPY